MFDYKIVESVAVLSGNGDTSKRLSMGSWNGEFFHTIEEIHAAAEADDEEISADEASAIRSKAVAALEKYIACTNRGKKHV